MWWSNEVGLYLSILQLSLLAKILSGKSRSEPLKPFTGIDYSASGQRIPDVVISVVAAIINHYVMSARNTTEIAKKVSLCLDSSLTIV